MLNQYNFSGFLEYKNGILHIDGIPYTEICSQQPSPTVCTSLDRMRSNVGIIEEGFKKIEHSIHYALKASYCEPLVTAIKNQGVGAEVISEYEWLLAKKAGFPTKQIIMNGLGRTAEELINTINDEAIVNIDSLSELKKLLPFKESFQKNHKKIGLRIHPNFNGDGNFVKRDGKLGMSYSEARECMAFARNLGLEVNGFSFHIFSNQTDPNIYTEPMESLTDFVKTTEQDFRIKCDYVDIGGGVAPRMFFKDDAALTNFMGTIASLFSKYFPLHTKLLVEPGRYIVADTVVIFSRIKTIKRNSGGTWAVLDIGTKYLIPAPGSDFKILPCNQGVSSSVKPELVKFVDGICSPAGFIGEAMLNVEEGQVVAIVNCGAYTSVMKEEFVFGSPRHVYLENGKIVGIINKTSFENFAEYHGWK